MCLPPRMSGMSSSRSSPLAGISQFERANDIPANYINVCIMKMGEHGVWERLERGELTLSEFYPLFGSELSRPENLESYRKFLVAKKLPLPTSFRPRQIDGEALFTAMMAGSVPNPRMIHAIHQLKRAGLKVGAITNTWHTHDGTSTMPEAMRRLFDDVVESAKVGLRKPDPKIFQLACSRLSVRPEETAFLDDLGVNLKAAHHLGMRPIRVWIGKEDDAIRELEALTQLRLLPDSNL